MRLILWLCALPFRLLRRFATLFTVIALCASLLFNAAMLTVTGVYSAASAALSGIGVTTVAAREAGERLARRKAAQEIGRETAQTVTRRMQRGAARNIASVGGEAIPVVGIAVIAGALTLEVKDACDTAADMSGLEAALATEGDAEDASIAREVAIATFDCQAMIREQLPGFQDLPSATDIWISVTDAPALAYQQAQDAGIALRDADWSGKTDDALIWLQNWKIYLGDWFAGENEEPEQ